MIGYNFRENGSAHWNGCPAGCFCIDSINLCYWNLNGSGRDRGDVRPLCETGHADQDGFIWQGNGLCADANGRGFSTLIFENKAELDERKVKYANAALAASRVLIGLEYKANGDE